VKGSDLTITVSEEKTRFRYVNQQDPAPLEITQSVVFQAEDVERFVQSISNIAAYNNIRFTDYQPLQSQVAELVTNPDQLGFLDSARELCKKYDWALRPLSVLFATVIGVQ
jgi:hypothetical protein